jgi:UDP-glucuronate decarboxylase
MLGLAKRVKAKIFQASTSEVYGDPSVHPQKEDYWGNVNPIGHLTYGPRMHPNDGRVVSNFIIQARCTDGTSPYMATPHADAG